MQEVERILQGDNIGVRKENIVAEKQVLFDQLEFQSADAVVAVSLVSTSDRVL